MTLEIRSVADAGDLEKERIILRATADVEIGHYTLLCCESGDNGNPLSGEVLAFWFEFRRIKTGDFIVVYSKLGITSQKEADNGSTSYFYYWRSGESIWKPTKMPVLLLSPTWDVGEIVQPIAKDRLSG